MQDFVDAAARFNVSCSAEALKDEKRKTGSSVNKILHGKDRAGFIAPPYRET
jgi:hypothetical protein